MRKKTIERLKRYQIRNGKTIYDLTEEEAKIELAKAIDALSDVYLSSDSASERIKKYFGWNW